MVFGHIKRQNRASTLRKGRRRRQLLRETLESRQLMAADMDSIPPFIGPVPLAGALPPNSGPFPDSDTFLLHSRPSATKVVYLDFDGHTTTGTPWNSSLGVTSIVTPAYTLDGSPAFSSAELTDIQYMWQRVAEAFSPFDVDVTTEDPGIEALRNTGNGDVNWGFACSSVAIGARFCRG